MRAVVLGKGWGQVHVRALREHGVDVVGLGGRPQSQAETETVARSLDIPHAVSTPDQVRALAPDLVTLATPASTHADLLGEYAELPVICEKPLLGLHGDPGVLQRRQAATFVTYGFAFLEVAEWLATAVATAGATRRVHVETTYDLPSDLTPDEWVLEAASHPLSFVTHLVGPPTFAQSGHVPHGRRLELLASQVPITVVSRREAGIDGMAHSVTVETDEATFAVRGSFEMGGPWTYGPVRRDGEAISDVEADVRGGLDCWHRATSAAIGAAVRTIATPSQAPDRRLTSIDTALAIDLCVRSSLV